MEYKIFEDLVFKPFIPRKALRAILAFPNGWSISVIKWLNPYDYLIAEFECACFQEYEGYVCFHHFIGWDDVVKKCMHEEEITDIMKQIQDLK